MLGKGNLDAMFNSKLDYNTYQSTVLRANGLHYFCQKL